MTVLQIALFGSLLASLAYLTVVSTVALITALRVGGRREDDIDADDALAASRLTMPVSIVVPVDRALRVSETLTQLLALNYPEFEIIVVADAGALDVPMLSWEWRLEAREFFYRRTLDTAPVLRIFRSLRDPRIVVVEKDPAERSDALNCGINFARYRFVAVVPTGITFDRAALLRAITPALRDPMSVVGICSGIERVPSGSAATDIDARFQRLRSLRALVFTRLFWSRLQRGLCAGDGVFIWRRDAVLQANGFAKEVPDAELDMMLRLQRSRSETRRFVRTEDPFGQAGTRPSGSAQRTVAWRQRAALRAAVSWGLAARQSVGARSFGAFVESELLRPAAQLWLALGSTVAAMAGWTSWITPVAALLLLTFGTAAVTVAALLVRGSHGAAPPAAELGRLALLAPLEVLLHRPAYAWARVNALFGRMPARP